MADPREVTAYHEAGHGVAALALGRPVAWVSIRPDRKYLGLCAFGKGVFRPSEDWVEREAILSLAGPAAEAGFTGAFDWAAAAQGRLRPSAQSVSFVAREIEQRITDLAREARAAHQPA